MTSQQELTLLETAYTNFLNGGAIQSYQVAGRMVTRADIKWMTQRIDVLRRQVSRESGGGMSAVVRFVDPE
jgi:hypothetical protein